MNKKISSTVGILIIILVAGVAGASVLLFNENIVGKEANFIEEEDCKEAIIPEIQDEIYSDARAKIIASGWSPFQTREEEIFGSERVFWDYGYKEVHSCAGTGLSPCIFIFKDECLNYLKVSTVGEEHPSQEIYAKISHVKMLNKNELAEYIK